VNSSQETHPLQRLFYYTEKYRQKIWLASACSILNKLFDLAPPALIGAAVDVVVQK
jgi:ATP-binding cassette subfamily B protein